MESATISDFGNSNKYESASSPRRRKSSANESSASAAKYM